MHSSILAWRIPLPDREAWQATVYRVAKSQTRLKRLCAHRHKTFFFFACGSSIPVSWAWRWHSCLACRDAGGVKCGGTRTASLARVMALSVFFQAACSWWSEGLLGLSFSIAPSLQALKGLPYLRSFSGVLSIRHIEGAPWLVCYSVDWHSKHLWGTLGEVLLCSLVQQSLKGAPRVGSYSVVQCVMCLMGQTLCCSATSAGEWGERGYGDSSTPYAWLSSITLLPWLPGFPSQAFPTTVSSLTSPWFISLQSTAALTLGLFHSP